MLRDKTRECRQFTIPQINDLYEKFYSRIARNINVLTRYEMRCTQCRSYRKNRILRHPKLYYLSLGWYACFSELPSELSGKSGGTRVVCRTELESVEKRFRTECGWVVGFGDRWWGMSYYLKIF
jgi:hypothetical protein